MKKKTFMTLALMALAMSASAQVQLLFLQDERCVIDRNKKLFWMDGDDDPCFNILNYKKTGNKETFTIKEKENPSNTYNVTTTVNDKGETTHITLSHKQYGTRSSEVKVTCGKPEEDERLYKYFNELAGNPYTPSTSLAGGAAAGGASGKATKGVPRNAGEAKGMAVDKAADKVKDTAKKAFGKVKGLFNKK